MEELQEKVKYKVENLRLDLLEQENEEKNKEKNKEKKEKKENEELEDKDDFLKDFEIIDNYDDNNQEITKSKKIEI